MQMLDHHLARPFSLALLLVAAGCDREVTAPQHHVPASPLFASASNLSGRVVAQFHDHFTVSVPADSGVEICGIPSNLKLVVTDNFFLLGDGSFKDASSVKSTYTNPSNGKAVVISGAGQVTGQAIVDEVARTITFVTNYKGLPEKIQTANGPVLTRDAGIITFADKFNLDTFEFISGTIVSVGPHPEADSNFSLGCEVISAALT